MHVIIDFGTSRTAVAVIDRQGSWQAIGQPVSEKRVVNAPGWRSITNMIEGVIGVRRGDDANVPHIITYSSYCKIGDLVVPISIAGTAISFPVGAEVVPPLAPQHGEFVSVKENADLARHFLGAVTEMVNAWAPAGADWIIGETCRGISHHALNLPHATRIFNEAAAVIFALVAVTNADLVREGENTFVVLADLGGGFLDICVAHKVVLGEHNGSATIVNYGGYPIGVDRISLRFSREMINNPDSLIRLIVTTIAYHISDYCQRVQVQQKTKHAGVVFLTGGGFKRIENAYQRIADQLIPLVRQVSAIAVTVDTEAPRYDTKRLTVAGLARMGRLGAPNITPGDDISDKDPRHHGTKVLQYQGIEPGPEALTWWGLLAARLRTSYGLHPAY